MQWLDFLARGGYSGLRHFEADVELGRDLIAGALFLYNYLGSFYQGLDAGYTLIFWRWTDQTLDRGRILPYLKYVLPTNQRFSREPQQEVKDTTILKLEKYIKQG